MVVTVTADYDNHDNYPSPIGIVDLSNWQTTYGTSISGSAPDNNDGTMIGTLTILRAGTYTLTVLVDDVDVITSPFSYLEVEPYNLYAPSCVNQDIPTQMYAGYLYSFLVQGRDQYSNNIALTLSSAVGSSHSVVPSLSTNSGTTFTGSITDDTFVGVYLVDFSVSKT